MSWSEPSGATGWGRSLTRGRHTAQVIGLPYHSYYLRLALPTNVLPTAYHAGILLNLSGYGYRFSAERGVEIGTLAEVRSPPPFLCRACLFTLPTSCFLLPTSYFLLPTSCFSLLTTYDSLLTAHCSPRTTYEGALLLCGATVRGGVPRRGDQVTTRPRATLRLACKGLVRAPFVHIIFVCVPFRHPSGAR